jgi:AcrR family transcriptional regulator
MGAATATSSTATGPGRRAGLGRDEVVDAALALVEAEGADALTMRKLAAELGVTTTTIYWHAGSRDELVEAVIARYAERHAPGPFAGRTPAQRIEHIAVALWRSARDHPNVSALAYRARATSQLGQPYHEAMAAELAAAGVGGAEARLAVGAIVRCVAGFLVVEQARRERGEEALLRRTVGAVIGAFLP